MATPTVKGLKSSLHQIENKTSTLDQLIKRVVPQTNHSSEKLIMNVRMIRVISWLALLLTWFLLSASDVGLKYCRNVRISLQ